MEHAPALANIEEPLVEPTAQADAMETSSDYEEKFGILVFYLVLLFFFLCFLIKNIVRINALYCDLIVFL